MFNLQEEKIINSGKRVIEIEIEELTKLKNRIDENFLSAVKLLMNCSGKVIVTGVGKSGVIARKLAATLSSTGTPALFLHAAEGLHGDLGAVSEKDVVICISKSGNSEEINNILPFLKRMGVPIVGMTANADSVLGKFSDIILDISVEKEACPNGLAPTASTTVTMALGDALAVALLEQKNFTRDDFAFLHPGGALGKRLLLKVDDLMEVGDKVGKVGLEATMKEAVLEMANKRGICAIVDKENYVKGVITTGDLNRLVKKTEHFFHIPVTEIMNPNPKVIHQGTLAYNAYKKMEEYRIIAMPVLDESNKLVGMIHLHDIMRAGIV